MATLILTPNSASVEVNGAFAAPTTTGTADDGTTDVSGSVTGPVPAADMASEGVQTLIYTLPANITGGADEVAVEQTAAYTLTVTAVAVPGGYPTPASNPGFADGSTDRTGTDTSGTTYEATVAAASAGTAPDAAQSAYFDEQGLDPYERANCS